MKRSVCGRGSRTRDLTRMWPQLLVISLAASNAPRAEAQLSIEQVVANVRANEELYRDIEIIDHYSSRLDPVMKTRFKPNRIVEHADWTARLVLQRGMAFYQRAGSQTSLDQDTANRDNVHGFDGTTTRILEQHKVGNIRQGPAPDGAMAISPFTILLEDDHVALPLSTLLAGGPELEKHPLAGWYGREDNKTSATKAGEEVVDGLACVKVRIEQWHPSDRAKGELSGGDTYIWLAVDRNYLPIKMERYSSELNRLLKGPRPTGIGRVEGLREIEPGIWFPLKTAFENYTNFTTPDRTKLELSSVKRHVFEKVDLHPSYPVSLFRDIEFPRGCTVYEVDANGRIVRRYIEGEARPLLDQLGGRWRAGFTLMAILTGGSASAFLFFRSRRNRRG
jgi:hypothetical protein